MVRIRRSRCSNRGWSVGRVVGVVAVAALLVIFLYPLAVAVIPLLVVAGLLVALGRIVFRR